MLRILLIAHAPLASALKAVAAHIDAEAALRVAAVDVSETQSLDDAIDAGRRAIAGLGGGETLVLTDVYGATPCNAACALGKEWGARVIAGTNVPALWRALGHLNESLDAVTQLAMAGGQRGLIRVDVNGPGDTS